MSSIDNNKFEVKPSPHKKRKISTPLPAAYTNPALDLLASDDLISNTTMEVQPGKRRKRTRSCGEAGTFHNTALDLGVDKAAVSEFLVKELENVKRNLNLNSIQENDEPEYSCVDEDKNVTMDDSGNATQITESHTSYACNGSSTSGTAKITVKKIVVENPTNLSLSFIDRLTIDSPGLSQQSLYLDDDLNESNIMEIKMISIIAKKKQSDVKTSRKSTNPFLNCSDEITDDVPIHENPFLSISDDTVPAFVMEPNNMEVIEDENDASMSEPPQVHFTQVAPSDIVPRRLFSSDNNSTVSTVNDLSLTNVEMQNEYENIDSLKSESPIYANIDEVYAANENYNKQSKILGHDVSQFDSRDILNLNRRNEKSVADSMQSLSSNDTSESKKSHDFTHQINKLSKKVFRKLKRTFTGDKPDHNATLNPYEVPRKAPKVKAAPSPAGVENPALKLDYSDEIEEIDDDAEHLYETVKTTRNTRLNMNLTPLRESNREAYDPSFPLNSTNTSGRKQVRFDSTLNQEKVITGNSFDEDDMMSPGLDSEINNFHDELENCINEKKFIAQNM